MTQHHQYDDSFFDWVEAGALRSARRLLPFLKENISVHSVADVGCGTGAWLSVWRELGAGQTVGIDGDYVRRDRLQIPASSFIAADLGGDWNCAGKFDLVQSLEVAEHLPPAAAPRFVEALTRLSDIVLFSAAQPGQGGERHVNERPPAYWKALFESHGFHAFDCVRPRFYQENEIEPWYRYNVLLFANSAGRTRLSPEILAKEIPPGEPVPSFEDWKWKFRRAVLKPLPVPVVTLLSKYHYRARNALRGKETAAAGGTHAPGAGGE